MRAVWTAAMTLFTVLVTSQAMAGAGVDGEVTIPEPTTIALFAAGAAGVLILRKRLGRK